MRNKVIFYILMVFLTISICLYIGYPISRIDLQSILLVIIPTVITAALYKNFKKDNQDENNITDLIAHFSLYWGLIVGLITLLLLTSYFTDLKSFIQDFSYVIQPMLFGIITRLLFTNKLKSAI